ncbi:extracellular solute-binding protein [Phaeacidiphilus oryzae]|jgi:arabinogalactan oligomer/maltooligosaccharide transport system substrate-binding protein|uniref:extracellular solute-binding protein n=1 Tax=Phaeacidiphilus oryzae TaxID=348818 RepID=UPI000568DDA9|nr:extracellular solute-binding protein [Phaeacidiphilus oryzae]
MQRRIAASALAVAIALAASACGSSGGGHGQSASGDPSAIAGTITYWDTSDATAEAPAYQALIKQFEAKYPKIHVNYVNVPFANVEQKFKTAAQSGKGAPDVMRADVGLVDEYATLGYLAPLDGTRAVADTPADFLKGPEQTAKVNGKTYGVPSVTDTLGLLYNKALFKKAGIAAPPKTWQELISDSAVIKQKTGAYGTYLNPDSYFLLPFLYGEGADMVDPASKKITISRPQAVAALAEAKKVYDTSSMKVDFANAYDNMQTAFKTGKVAMLVQGPWSTADDFTGSAFADKSNLGIAPVPAGSTGHASAPTGGHDLVVYAGSGQLAASELFTEFMTSTAAEQQIALKNGTLPARSSAYTAKVLADPSIAGFRPVLDTARPRAQVAQVGSLFTPLATAYIKVLQGTETPQQGADDAAKGFKSLLPGYSVG